MKTLTGNSPELRDAVRAALRQCLDVDDVRDFEGIRDAVDEYLSARDLSATRQLIQVQVSRETTAHDPRKYITAHTRPPRFVSRRRVNDLTRKARLGSANPGERKSLVEMLADLRSAAEYWQRRHARAAASFHEAKELAEPAARAVGEADVQLTLDVEVPA